MLLAAHSWRLRKAARDALSAGDLDAALVLASEAQELQSTRSGEALRRLSVWLKKSAPSGRGSVAH